jgi:DNA excision repair protein ERCC-4
MKIRPTAVIDDSREQVPFAFEHLPVVRAGLATGDYSVVGLEHLIACERKELADLLACCGRERDRFKAELQRLRAYRFRLLVVEADADDLERGDWRSRLTPNHVLGNLSAWCAQYGLPIWLGGSHEAAGRFVERWLYQCARCIAQEYEAARALVETGAGVTA